MNRWKLWTKFDECMMCLLEFVEDLGLFGDILFHWRAHALSGAEA